MKALAPVLVMRETNLRDVPGALRCLADSIEAGNFGDVVALAWVLEGDNVDVGFCGTTPTFRGAEAHLLLHAGAHRLVSNALAGKDTDQGG